jgi:hypothetical protein
LAHVFLPPPLTVETPLPIEASQPDLCVRQTQPLQIGKDTFLLPGGYVDQSGTLHREVQLAPLTGHEEYFLADLDARTCSATAITELLTRCVRRIGSLTEINVQLIRDLLVGDRDYLMIRQRQLTFGQKVDCVLRCPDTSCGKLMDLTFDLNDIEFEDKAIRQRYFTTQLSSEVEGAVEENAARTIEFRLPNGTDQETCAALFAVNQEMAVKELLSRCVRWSGDRTAIDKSVIESLDRATRLEIERQMHQLAPHCEIELDALCPECGRDFGVIFDPLKFFLDELRVNFRNLEHDLHFLAWHYHWSEREILSMTWRQRRRYVALLQEEVDRLNQI